MPDSRPATMNHIWTVRKYISQIRDALYVRGLDHDQSKLQEPEKSIFDEHTPKLSELTYGSEEYHASRAAMKVALDHHYAVNSHHPEYHEDGIHGMDLLDIVEMLADWKAATERHKDGDLAESIRLNRERFGYGDEIEGLLTRTAEHLGWFAKSA